MTRNTGDCRLYIAFIFARLYQHSLQHSLLLPKLSYFSQHQLAPESIAHQFNGLGKRLTKISIPSLCCSDSSEHSFCLFTLIIMSVFPFPLISDGPPRSSSLTAVRAIFRICGGTDVFGPDKRQTATIISIAHMTEWSAELIANKIHEYFGTETSAEIVWDTYKYWEDVRSEMHPNGPTLGEDLKITKDMVCILRQHEIMPNFHARPLSQTPRPVCHIS
jgi:hypothetical protein